MAVLRTTMNGNRLANSGISWGWMLALGVLMVLLGFIGLGMTFWLTLVSTVWLGALVAVGGITQIFDSFVHHKGWRARLSHLAIGFLYLFAAAVMIFTPISAAFWLTIMLAISLIAVGLMRLYMAFQVRGRGGAWIAVLLSALISVLMGVLIFSAIVPSSDISLATPEGQTQWISAWGWIIGLIVAFELLMEGTALIALGAGAKRGARMNYRAEGEERSA